ncbi:hypothetical protein O6H91_13G103800 [Diphasiastrum complanatum]|uniref:Uncharacterized protein n=1 Tax=Diphasiastrum complanatum TaxID=34168 RepID=A0ACC2BXY8_DIPCM|nr:hypothetical protein O6H91_13G103800 [Diphasiastrum complanatum]
MAAAAAAALSQSSDDAILVERVGKEDLELIETAILRLLKDQQVSGAATQKHKGFARPSHEEDDERSAEEMGYTVCSSELEKEEHPRATGKEFDLLSKLLKQVHNLKSQRRSNDFLQKQKGSLGHSELSGLSKAHLEAENREGTELKEATETALKAAMAAADAAKAAAVSVAKNSEAIESLLKTLNSHSEEAEDSSILVSVQQLEESHEKPRTEKKKKKNNNKDIAKVLEKQNRVTHWILGFMVVATSIWRFKVISLVLKFQRKLTNPFESLGGIFSEGSKCDHHNHLLHHKDEETSERI